MTDASCHFNLEETSDRGSPVITTIDDDDETCCGPVEVASEDVITISSSEGNTKECYTEPGRRKCIY